MPTSARLSADDETQTSELEIYARIYLRAEGLSVRG
jgi:hypothetical protein